MAAGDGTSDRRAIRHGRLRPTRPARRAGCPARRAGCPARRAGCPSSRDADMRAAAGRPPAGGRRPAPDRSKAAAGRGGGEGGRRTPPARHVAARSTQTVADAPARTADSDGRHTAASIKIALAAKFGAGARRGGLLPPRRARAGRPRAASARATPPPRAREWARRGDWSRKKGVLRVTDALCCPGPPLLRHQTPDTDALIVHGTRRWYRHHRVNDAGTI